MNEKKSYQKPQVNQVKLALDEAVLGGCKVVAGEAGPSVSCCTNLAAICQSTLGSS